MKTINKIISIVLALTLIFTLGISVYAATSSTIKVTNATVGATYSVYKLFDATVNGKTAAYTYTKAGTTDKWFTALGKEKSPFKLTKSAAGAYTVEIINGKKDTDIVDFLSDNLADLPTAISTQKATETTVTFSGLASGYYYVKSTLNDGANLTITTLGETKCVIDKNQAPSSGGDNVKTIDATEDVVALANIGDTVSYTMKLTATNYDADEFITGYTAFDKFGAGLTFGQTLITSVKVGTTVVPAKSDSKPYGYVLTKDADNQGFRVYIPWVEIDDGNVAMNTDGTPKFIYGNTSSKTVTVTYSLVVDSDITTGIDNSNATNVGTWVWSKTKPETDGDNDIPVPPPPSTIPEGEWPTNNTTVATTEIVIAKVDSESGLPLTGAKFKITGKLNKLNVISSTAFAESTSGTYYKLKTGAYTTVAPTQDTASFYDSTTKKYKRTESRTTKSAAGDTTLTLEGTVDESGYLVFSGLGAGKFTVTEIEAPNGYNLLTSDINVDIELSDGKISVNDNTDISETGIYNLSVENSVGTQFPATGGIGTRIFYAVGGILMLGATVLLITKKKMSSERD